MPMVATIDDVAEAAGVSPSTVSYVLSGKRSISAPTRARVEAAIKALDYRPHAGARALASNRTNVIALQSPLREGVDVAIIMQFVTGVVTRAREYNYDVLLNASETTGSNGSAIQRIAGGSMVDGLVIMDIESDDWRVPILRKLRQPSVLIGIPDDPQGLSCIDLDFKAAGRLAVSHYAKTGHKDIGVLGSPKEVLNRGTAYAVRMKEGLYEEAARQGVSVHYKSCDTSHQGAVSALTQLLTENPGITALVIHNEVAMPFMLGALRDLGRDVPGDISLMAICPSNMAASQPIPITNIDLPALQIGQLTVDMVMARLEGDVPTETRLVSPELIVRETTVSI